MSEPKQTEAVLSLGGNLGDVPGTFRQAIRKLESGGLASIRISSLFTTPPEGCGPGTPDFINAAAAGLWGGTLEELHALCKNIEVAAGRPEEHVRFDSRTLDIDIIFFGDLLYSDQKLCIPHKEAAKRLFVLIPVAELAGDWIFPGGGTTVNEILAQSRGTKEFTLISATRCTLPE
ncbi:MAG TPA: 2-amino-4-hydroxy-6-hydroxymethyldihydropteridine diphosphokinase [Lentisphaeria bacterium]|nr:MAG: 2-amino-4-hydroxy-6-hydroxymethyldihydropteridine diphosphokinase [Lentisphaerae bacterium GWF2_50_93]HCE44887.1 2-amino-4-hydroxy-6-hydroxymethyldihydropteridine diphosphokinase [Lentisphaeria bacterium]